MNRSTGESLTRPESIEQSINTILTTPIGSRVMRRDFGSVLPLLIDQPLIQVTLLRAYSASIVAVRRWEDRVTIARVRKTVDTESPGRAVFVFDMVDADGQPQTARVRPTAA